MFVDSLHSSSTDTPGISWKAKQNERAGSILTANRARWRSFYCLAFKGVEGVLLQKTSDDRKNDRSNNARVGSHLLTSAPENKLK